MNRRSLLSAAAAAPFLAAAVAGVPASIRAIGAAGDPVAGAADGPAAAPAADPAVDPRLARYPRLVISLGEDRITAPRSVSAGPTLLIEDIDGAGPGHAFVLRVPDDVADAALADALRLGAPADETPEWFWRAEFVGNGDRAAAGRPAIAAVDLRPGRYLVGDPYRPAPEFAVFEATGGGEGRAPLPDFEVDARADLFEMGFKLPDRVATGRQVWEVTNTGAMLHEIAILPVPAGATPAEVETAVAADLAVEGGGDPAAARAAIDALGAGWAGWQTRLVAGVAVMSGQRAAYAQFDFAPGAYGAVCYVPEPTTMTPHLMLGMTAVFAVEPSAA